MSDTPTTRRRFPPLPLTIPAALLCAISLIVIAKHFQSSTPPKEAPPQPLTQAPDFSLRDIQKDDTAPLVTLTHLLDHGPVLIIFHRGFNCPVCIQHLAEVARHNQDFIDAGIQLVAIGPDTMPTARDDLVSFPAFPFPLLSDPDDTIARAYHLDSPTGLLHGAFLIEKQKQIHPLQISNEPAELPELLQSAKSLATHQPQTPISQQPQP